MVTKGMFWNKFYFVVVLLSCNCFLLCCNGFCKWIKEVFGCGQSETTNDSDNGKAGNQSAGNISSLKCVFLSSAGYVGKTSISKYLWEKKFDEKYGKTICANYFFVEYKVAGKCVKIQLWDCSSDKKFRATATDYYKNANAIIFVYDITNVDSLKSLEKYIPEVVEKAPKGCLFFLLGNKLDLIEQNHEERQVTIEDAKKLVAKKFAAGKCLIFLGECSAKKNTYMPDKELYYKKESLQGGKCTDGLHGMLKYIIYKYYTSLHV